MADDNASIDDAERNVGGRAENKGSNRIVDSAGGDAGAPVDRDVYSAFLARFVRLDQLDTR